MDFKGFIGGSYTSRTKNLAADECMNLYPELAESGTGKNVGALISTPGLDLWGTLPTTPVRGLWAGDDRLFAAGGAKLYEVSSSGVPTELGSIANDGGPVQIFPNGNQLFIVSAGEAYCDNGAGPVQAPVPADPTAPPLSAPATIGTASCGCFLDSYFVAAKPDSKKFFTSNPLDGTTWDELEFETKEGYPDNINAILASHKELWIGGDQTMEVWRQEGDVDHIWRLDPGAFIHQGVLARHSFVRFANGVAWIGGDTEGRCVAWRAQGFQPVRFSTHAVEQAWESYSTVADAFAFTYSDAGHVFYQVTFPTANATWVYDWTTKLWHRRGWWNGTSIDKHRASCHAFVFGRHLVGDHTSGKIYHMSHAYGDDDGTHVKRYRTAPHLSNEDEFESFSRFRVAMEDTGASPTLAWSTDGGAAFTAERTAQPHDTGDLTIYEWRRLGRSRDRVYRVTVLGSDRVAMTGAQFEA